MSKRLEERCKDLNNALLRLDEAIEESKINKKSSTLKDGVIQRFEFSYELCWKLMKNYLEDEGIQEAKSPKSTFREAFKIGIIKDGDIWIDMLNDRNLTSHVYDEEISLEIYNKIIDLYNNELKNIYNFIVNKIGE